MTIVGAIIAGGQSRRFGSDKATALLDGKALIDHVIDALSLQVDMIVIVGRAWGRYATVDDYPFSCGPLSGLCAALRFAQQHGHDHVLSVGCDVLPIPLDLLDVLEGYAPAVIIDQRLLGLWPSVLAGALEQHIITQPNHALCHWIEVSGAREMASPIPLHNLNTPEDLEEYSHYSAR
jgi:molybdopterin-guanine dinucleotide biosynthesis protein A